MLPRHLYVHVPFCSRRCVYCDFSIAVRTIVPVADYLDGIRRELTGVVASGAPQDRRWQLDTLYLGGGTPSKLGAEGVRDLLAIIQEFAELAPYAELTIEANPEDVTAESAFALADAGVNRLSLGAQSFNDAVLSWMHRTHSAAQIGEAVRLARAAAIDNISLDLIFAIPKGIERNWSDDLDHALALEPRHVSLYGLTIEPATPLARWTGQRTVAAASEDDYAAEFLLAHERMTSAGFEHYEVSNFAQPGCASRHNSAYWSGVPYLGIGPSAHSFDGHKRTWNVKPYSEWLHLLQTERLPVDGGEILDAQNMVSEAVYLGLRTRSGYPVQAADKATVDQWTRAGWAAIDGDLVRLSPEGWLRLDSLAAGLTGS